MPPRVTKSFLYLIADTDTTLYLSPLPPRLKVARVKRASTCSRIYIESQNSSSSKMQYYTRDARTSTSYETGDHPK